MNCPSCRHDNPSDARFCAQCGAALTPPATAAPQPARRGNAGRIVVAVIVLLLFLTGSYFVFHPATNKTATAAPGGARTAARPDDSTAKAAGPQQAAPSTGNAFGSALGAGAKGEPDQGKAQDAPTQTPQPTGHDDKSGGTTTRTPDAGDSGQATGAMGGLLSALTSAVGGAHRHDPVDFHTLEALLPSSLPNMQPGTPDGNADDTMSIKTTWAHVDFTGPNDGRIHLSIRDATAISGLAGLANMANPDESAQGGSYEKTETIDGRSVHEKWDAPTRHGELSLSVGGRFAVDAVGDNVDMDALKNALAHIDLAKLESMKDANPITK